MIVTNRFSKKVAHVLDLIESGKPVCILGTDGPRIVEHVIGLGYSDNLIRADSDSTHPIMPGEVIVG